MKGAVAESVVVIRVMKIRVAIKQEIMCCFI